VRKYQPNPLNIFGLRELEHCPPHFFPVDFDLSCNPKKISDWIWENLEGRFYFGDTYGVDQNNRSSRTFLQKRAAFEIHSEASYFAMILSDLNKF
jgi:hypothetical protein